MTSATFLLILYTPGSYETFVQGLGRHRLIQEPLKMKVENQHQSAKRADPETPLQQRRTK